MNGFLSNTWRDIFTVAGVALPCIQLLLSWATRKTNKEPWFRLGILEAYRDYHENQDDAPLDPEAKRLLWIALATGALITFLGSVFSRYGGFFALLLPLMLASAFAHEVSLVVFIFLRFPTLTARENERLVAPILFLIYIGLFFLAYWGGSLDKGVPIDEPSSPWWLNAVTIYSNCYMVLAGMFCVGEVVASVARWRKKHRR